MLLIGNASASTAVHRDEDGLLRRIGWGLAIIAVVFSGVGIWSATASLDGAVIAPGTIQVETHRKAVQHLEGGIVKEIRVREGDTVKTGDVLIVMDDTTTNANFRLIQGQVAELAVRRSRLIAERDGAGEMTLPRLPAGLRDDAGLAAIIAGQRKLFHARQASLSSAVELLRQQQGQLRTQIAGLEKQRASKARQIEFYDDELKGLRGLFERGLTTKSRMLALERRAETERGAAAGLDTSIATAQMKINEMELEVLRLHKTFQEKVAEELRSVEADINALSERSISAQDQVQRTEIRAPRNGRVLGLAAHTVGGVIKPGETIMEIVPEDDSLVIGARIAPQDIDKVRAEAPATVRLSAFNQRTTPELAGSVLRVSPDQVTDPHTGQAHYLAVIEIEPSAMESLHGLALTPGMPAEAFIRTGARTPLSYLIKPLTDSLSRAFRED